MFSPNIVDSDAFLDMPPTAQNLYFHLGMRADDDGFVGNPKKIMRMLNIGDDDLKILLAKRFVLAFESGVIVIKHWRINNLIRKDWYRETVYKEEKKLLEIKDNGSYTEKTSGVVNELLTSSVQFRSRRLGKVRLGKVRLEREGETPSVLPSKRERTIDFIKNITTEEAQELAKEIGCTENFVKEKAKDLHDYCLSHGKIYKDYKAFLRNACRKDYKENKVKTEKTVYKNTNSDSMVDKLKAKVIKCDTNLQNQKTAEKN